jgi:hypothetical protein
VFGEFSILLDQLHTADVGTLESSEFHESGTIEFDSGCAIAERQETAPWGIRRGILQSEPKAVSAMTFELLTK